MKCLICNKDINSFYFYRIAGAKLCSEKCFEEMKDVLDKYLDLRKNEPTLFFDIRHIQSANDKDEIMINDLEENDDDEFDFNEEFL